MEDAIEKPVNDLNQPWQPELNWETPAALTLRKLIDALPQERKFTITLFGSSPLQIGLEPLLLSADVDLFSDDDFTDAISKAKLAKGEEADVYVQQCVEWNFRTSPKWHRRAFWTEWKNCRVCFPHPIDILIAKLHRLEDKDMLAFHVVIAKTGHPTEAEMKRELQDAVDLFRPGFDEEGARGDILTNTRILWQELFGRDINVRQEIIRPAIEQRNAGMAYDLPQEDYKDRLREIAAAGYGGA